MRYVWTHRGNIFMAEPLGAISIGDWNYMFMTYVEGETLARHWPLLSSKLKSSILLQLGIILHCLRQIPSPSIHFGSNNPPLCKDLRRHVRTSLGSIATKEEFNKFLISGDRELNLTYQDLLKSGLRTNHQRVMTHSDLRPENIIVSYTGPDIISIIRLID